MKNNKYDYIIIVTIASIIFGLYGGALQPIRLISLFFIPFVFIELYKSIRKSNNAILNKCLIFFLFWYAYSLISLFWIDSLENACKELVYYLLHFNLFILLYLCSIKAINPLKSILFGWLAFFLLSVPIAMNEIINDKHLYLSKLDSDQYLNLGNYGVVSKRFAAVTFGNYNTYVTVLCYFLPFLFTYIIASKNKLSILVGSVCLVILSYILLSNASRGGLICLIITFLVFLYFINKKYRKKKMYILPLIFSIIAFLIVYYGNEMFEQISYRLVVINSVFNDESRLGLLKNGFSVFLSTYGVGSGIGGLFESMKSYSNTLYATHNLFMEVLIQYGLVIFLCVMCFVYFIYKCACNTKSLNVKHLLFSSLLSLPFISVINSLYLLLPSTWVFFSCLLIFAIRNKDDRFF